MFSWSLTYQKKNVFKQHHKNKNLSAFYLQNGGDNGGHRDMKQN